MTQDRYLTITGLTRYIKRKFELDEQLVDVWLRGEISNFKQHSRGHMYLTLKDENSRIQSVMFAGHNRSLGFTPENGMKVLVRGEVSVYEPYGQYQLYIKEMQPDGIGNLYLAFEELKKRLEEEGLFLNEYKKPLPRYAQEIGVITSPTGAAIRDIFTTIKRRFPIARITLYPALVQGEAAADSIVQAVNRANKFNQCDVLIVGRGGGSIEDLWPFNEERVARSIFNSNIPIISAVGHETDFTIADFAADVRAPTPTGAAELAVPHIDEISDRLLQRKTRLSRAIKEKAVSQRDRLTAIQKSYAFRYPMQLIRQKEQELDGLLDRLIRENKRAIITKEEKWEQLHRRLQRNHPAARIQELNTARRQIEKRLQREMAGILKEKQMTFQQALAKLNALSPLRIMDRGYSLALKEDKLVKTIQDVQPGDTIQVRLKDGQLDCQVWGIEEGEKS
ncbi:exodeoxyribonuclease VII large subunit [Bacillus taeanensis]|uniref:Exodeoxyribonuclease 7 large subunit n=1 Tax=Bacillus taeanensis TaxID=273032 RepID=A0A366Y0P9_9BACI|nr:exodeoxyribonuclease VII large subunit [Bacillus taeanensis]RBW70609.1 exodeoxyribonuclease VII large subunit [Bacillus taeanensis]